MGGRMKAVAALAAASAVFCASDAYARAFVCSDFTGGVAQGSTRALDIRINLQPGETVTIKITDSEGPVEFDAPVFALVSAGQSTSYTANSAGTVEFSATAAVAFLSRVTCTAAASSSGSTQTQQT